MSGGRGGDAERRTGAGKDRELAHGASSAPSGSLEQPETPGTSTTSNAPGTPDASGTPGTYDPSAASGSSTSAGSLGPRDATASSESPDDSGPFDPPGSSDASEPSRPSKFPESSDPLDPSDALDPSGPSGGSSPSLGPVSTEGPADGDWAFADRPSGEEVLVGAPAGHDAARRTPLITGEGTHEIPVHLLFRDEVDPSVRRAPTVVGRRLGTGEQPRIRRTAPPNRPEPAVDPRFNERPGPALPGWSAAIAGALTLVGCLALLWQEGALPDLLTGLVGLDPQPYHGIGLGVWLLLTLGVVVLVFTLGGLSRGKVGHALVLTLFGEYRGSVRRTGLLWISPLLLRRRVDVRLRHWRSEPMPAMDANGSSLRVVVLVVWRVRDTVRATLGMRDHEEYLRMQVEAAMARVLSQLPADAFHGMSPTLRNVEAVGDSLTRVLSAECRPAGIEVFSAQPTRIEYAPEIADVMRRSRIAALDARHRDTVLGAVVDAVDDTVQRLTARGLVELDDFDRKALVKDLTVAFYTGRATGPGEHL
ncbi:SPFH domain-containing protein [Streptomyces fuscigenes]|uniref:SPFH domain-containing protein n=1 Tax=Streptomyces fuscigenes TaxID=1528880 RepID=UPI001EFF2693|nr:SPFH domain-containing protein [Streptomyces fuscigenes]MCF3961448.1 membrane protease subunit [Streptomyces fuscigenes]